MDLFIEKMLIAYPETDAQWLITGKGNMFINQKSLFGSDDENENLNILTQRESNIQENNVFIPENKDSEEESKYIDEKVAIKSKTEKEIERVIVFHKDGTFKEYKSE